MHSELKNSNLYQQFKLLMELNVMRSHFSWHKEKNQTMDFNYAATFLFCFILYILYSRMGLLNYFGSWDFFSINSFSKFLFYLQFKRCISQEPETRSCNIEISSLGSVSISFSFLPVPLTKKIVQIKV